MSWTTPRTWVAGELVTASIMNTHVRDNLQYVYDNMKPTSIQRVTVTYSSGGTTGTQSITTVNSTARSECFLLGDNPGTENATVGVINLSKVALNSTSQVGASRSAGTASGGGAITGTVNIQVTEWPA